MVHSAPGVAPALGSATSLYTFPLNPLHPQIACTRNLFICFPHPSLISTLRFFHLFSLGSNHTNTFFTRPSPSSRLSTIFPSLSHCFLPTSNSNAPLHIIPQHRSNGQTTPTADSLHASTARWSPHPASQLNATPDFAPNCASSSTSTTLPSKPSFFAARRHFQTSIQVFGGCNHCWTRF